MGLAPILFPITLPGPDGGQPHPLGVKLRIVEGNQLTKRLSCEKIGVNIYPLAFSQEDNDDEYTTSEWHDETAL